MDIACTLGPSSHSLALEVWKVSRTHTSRSLGRGSKLTRILTRCSYKVLWGRGLNYFRNPWAKSAWWHHCLRYASRECPGQKLTWKRSRHFWMRRVAFQRSLHIFLGLILRHVAPRAKLLRFTLLAKKCWRCERSRCQLARTWWPARCQPSSQQKNVWDAGRTFFLDSVFILLLLLVANMCIGQSHTWRRWFGARLQSTYSIPEGGILWALLVRVEDIKHDPRAARDRAGMFNSSNGEFTHPMAHVIKVCGKALDKTYSPQQRSSDEVLGTISEQHQRPTDWQCFLAVSGFPNTNARLQICPLYIFGNKATDGTYGPIDLNIGFQGLALIQDQIYSPEM